METKNLLTDLEKAIDDLLDCVEWDNQTLEVHYLPHALVSSLNKLYALRYPDKRFE